MTEHTYCVPIANFIRTLNVIADFQDVDTKDHSRKTRNIAYMIAEELDFTGDELLWLSYGADVHDIGKLAIEPHILRQATKLTRAQYTAVKKHPEYGAEMIAHAEVPRIIVDCVLFHHEHYDGTGYPKGFSGNEIPLHANICCVSDMWEAINSPRPYRKPYSREGAIGLMEKSKGWFYPEVYETFLRLVEEGKI